MEEQFLDPSVVALARHILLGCLIGVAASMLAQYALGWLRLRWTWALIPGTVGAGLLGVGVIEAWTVALTAAGWLTTCGAFRLERRAREAGGDRRRATHAKLGLIDVFARPLARAKVRLGSAVVGKDRYVLGYGSNRRLVSIKFGGQSGRHGLLLGATGSGKTNALLGCLGRHIEAGVGVVVIDMKADPNLASQLRQMAAQAGRGFQQWSLDGQLKWNPLRRGSPSELKDKLIESEEFSERHYQAMYERYLLNVFRALEFRRRERDLAMVVRLLDPAELAMFIRDMDDEETADEISNYLQRLTNDQMRDLRGLADRLALLIEGGHGRLLCPPPEEPSIDLLSGPQAGKVILFSLNSSTQGATAKLIANMVIQDLKGVCGTLQARDYESHPTVVALDEFSGLDGDQIAGLFQRARSAGMSLMLATQELADLRRVAEGFDEQIVGNVEWILAGRQNNPSSAETVAAIAGTDEVWIHTFQTDDNAFRSNAPFGRESGMGTRHRGREFVVSPDAIKALPVGRMVLIEKNPHRAVIVDVLPADQARTKQRKAA